MVDYQTLSIVLTGTGMIIALTYYALQIRNQNKTRQVQMFMNLYATYSSPQFRRRYNDITFNRAYENYDDFWEKYGPVKNPEAFASWTSVAAFFQGLGVLVRKGLIEIGLVHDFLGSVIIDSWEVMSPAFIESRERYKINLWDEFEYLYNEVKKLS
jgi:hypothetical protein